MGSGNKDSGRGSGSKKSSGSSGKQKKDKNTVSKKGKEIYREPIEEDHEECDEDEYIHQPPGSSVIGGTGAWSQSQLQAARFAGHAEDRDDISLSSGYSQNTQAPQAAGYNMSDVLYTDSDRYYGSSQFASGNSSAYPSNYSEPMPTYVYGSPQTADSNSLEERFRGLKTQSPDQNYQYGNPSQMISQAKDVVSMTTGYGYGAYNTFGDAQYGNSSQRYEQTPRASKPASMAGTNYNLQAEGHNNKHNQKLLGKHSYSIAKSKEYVVGYVLKTFWFEPAGSTTDGATQVGGTQLMAMNRGLPGKVRRFIIIQTFKGHSIAVPISSYGDQGTKKPGCHPEVHSMIYTRPEKEYLEGESPLRNPKIEMEPSGRDTLTAASRINYAKRYTIEHNLSVCFIGRIANRSSDDFWMTLNQVNATLAPPATTGDDDDDDDFTHSTTTRPGGGGPGGRGPSAGGADRSRRQTSSSSYAGTKGSGKRQK